MGLAIYTGVHQHRYPSHYGPRDFRQQQCRSTRWSESIGPSLLDCRYWSLLRNADCLLVRAPTRKLGVDR